MVNPKKQAVSFLKLAFARNRVVLSSYRSAEKRPVIDLINQTKGKTDMKLGLDEAYQIYSATKRTQKILGDIAEVGTYRGGSAKLICEAKGDKALHLFDTFEGLPEKAACDDKRFFKGLFASSLDAVKSLLKDYPNVTFYKGLFPDTALPIMNKRFSFVHLDVDIYQSTIDSLTFFYPRMSKGGVLISHDYAYSSGVKKAFDEFFADRLEPVIELSGSQCLVVKI
jgi:hypothetical protein